MRKISLRNAAICVAHGRQFVPDCLCGVDDFKGKLDVARLMPLLEALTNGSIVAKGKLAKARVDTPDFDLKISENTLHFVSAQWRSNDDFLLGIAVEDCEADVPAELWWNIGTIWEQSILWAIKGNEQFLERLRQLKPYPPSFFDPQSPYQREELPCFWEVNLCVDELSRVMGDYGSGSLGGGETRRTSNLRNAGRNSSEDWASVADDLMNKIESNPELVWASWAQVWADVQSLLRDPKKFEDMETPHKSFEEWLRRNDLKSLNELKSRIKTSRSYIPCKQPRDAVEG